MVSPAAPIDFNRDIRPIFSDNCYACHGPDQNKRKAGLRLDRKEGAFQKLESGNHALVPGDLDQSKLVYRITADDEDERMPPAKAGKRLASAQIDLLRRWIKEGARWADHWSYIPPVRPGLPEVKDRRWPRNAIDYFILARLEKEGLSPSPEAERAALIRRVSFDLTGLPPTLAEVDDFVTDRNADAYEKVVDRLLASPHFGERMAVPWLDLARYADTSGYHFDSPRFMWIWRDWVIEAFNRNLPFDRFTIEQIAGDLLPDATLEQKIASGFQRNVMTNDEGGADPAEYLSKYIVDRVNTTAAVWLGTTLGCAECHDHKYDRISQKEFYQFYAFFHNVPEKGLDGTRTENPLPRLRVPSREQGAQLLVYLDAIPAAEKMVQKREAELPGAQEQWEKKLQDKPAPAAPTNGLLLTFGFDETVHGITSAGATNEAKFQNEKGPAWTEGILGKALQLDGSNESFVEAGPAVDFDRTNAFAYGAWVRVKSKGGGTVLSKMEDGPSYRGFDLLVEDGKVASHIIHSWPENGIKVVTKESIRPDVWTHVLAAYDGSSKAKGLKIYLNGKEAATDVKADKLSDTITNGLPMLIGRRAKNLAFNGALDDVRFYGEALKADEVKALAEYPHLLVARRPVGERSKEEKAELKRFFRENEAADFIAAQAALTKLQQEKADLLKAIPTTMVMEEMEKPRDTFVLVRGSFQNKGEKVSADTPKFLPPLPDGAPHNRLGLARWLVATNNPLTARVTVNRFWQIFFGTGLVKTLNDFGSQGEWPSHPDLLDWLAVEFMHPETPAGGMGSAGLTVAEPWEMKHLLKLIVMSATYRQASAVTPGRLERDRYNRLLTRGPRLRLDAEFIRDNALAVSGLLNAKIGGESVKPYQPPGLWEITDRKYEQSKGEDLYRRGLYVYWKRAAHYPSFATFDAPNRETCTLQRPRTSTPLQSLVLMNDPVYVEAARALAERVLKEGGAELNRRLEYAFRLTLARHPTSRELATLSAAYYEQLENFREDKQAAETLLGVGESPVPKDFDAVELAAWTATANVLLNLNETITR